MINDLLQFLNYENIYLIANIGVIPCWLLLIFLPRAIITKILVKSVVIPLLLSTAYIFIAYQIFWLHFLTINLFAGNWIANDAQNFLVSRPLVIISLITTYFTGPLGLVLYWLIRIFYSKKINYYD